MNVTVWNVNGTPQEVRAALRMLNRGQMRGARRMQDAGPAAPRDAQETLRRVLDGRPLPAGQQAVLDALYQAGDEGLTLSALAAAVNRPEAQTRHILARMARRINRTPGVDLLHRPGITLFFDVTPAAGEWRYRMRKPLRKALDAQAAS